MGALRSILAAAAVSAGLAGPAAAFPWVDNDGPTLIWVTIRATSGEPVWSACRRVYQRDVHQAARLSATRVRCLIDHSRIYQPGERRQNFNRQ